MGREIHAVSSFCVCLKMSLKNLTKFVRFCQKMSCRKWRKIFGYEQGWKNQIITWKAWLLYDGGRGWSVLHRGSDKIIEKIGWTGTSAITVTRKISKKILEDFWKYVEEREREERIISEMWK